MVASDSIEQIVGEKKLIQQDGIRYTTELVKLECAEANNANRYDLQDDEDRSTFIYSAEPKSPIKVVFKTPMKAKRVSFRLWDFDNRRYSLTVSFKSGEVLEKQVQILANGTVTIDLNEPLMCTQIQFSGTNTVNTGLHMKYLRIYVTGCRELLPIPQ